MRCAVVGDPVGHSLSPVLHRAAYAVVGLEWTYDAHRVAAGTLGDFLTGLDGSWRGLSVTMPLKREALGLAEETTSRADVAGSCNTLLRREGRWVGDNTDLPGAVAAVRERYDGPVRSATVLGGGATAAATALATVELGAVEVRLLVRSPQRAADTAELVRRHPTSPSVTVGTLEDPVTGDVVVTTIPAGAQTHDLAARCAAAPVVFEVRYDPWPTPIAAAATGVLVSGLDLLVHQAALQFELFAGRPAPVAEMRAAGEGALRA